MVASFPDDRVRWMRNSYYSPIFATIDHTFALEPVMASLCCSAVLGLLLQGTHLPAGLGWTKTG